MSAVKQSKKSKTSELKVDSDPKVVVEPTKVDKPKKSKKVVDPVDNVEVVPVVQNEYDFNFRTMEGGK